MQLGPHLRARLPGQEPHRLPRVPQRQHEEPRPPVLPRGRVAHHRPVAVVDLRFLAGRRRDHHPRLDAACCRAASARSASRSRSPRGSRGRRPGPARSPSRCARERAPPRSPPGRARTRSRSAPARAPAATAIAQGRWTPLPWWPVLARRVGGHLRPEWPVLPAPESVDTSAVVAGFGGHTPGRPPRPRTAIPAAFRYALAVSRRTPVACSMRRSDHPSRPSASTCCFLSSLKTLLIPAMDHVPIASSTSRAATPWWPVFRCPSVAGFGCPPRSRDSPAPGLCSAWRRT